MKSFPISGLYFLPNSSLHEFALFCCLFAIYLHTSMYSLRRKQLYSVFSLLSKKQPVLNTVPGIQRGLSGHSHTVPINLKNMRVHVKAVHQWNRTAFVQLQPSLCP